MGIFQEEGLYSSKKPLKFERIILVQIEKKYLLFHLLLCI